MLYPQNGDRIVAIDSVTSFHPMYNSLVVCSHVAADAADRATVETATTYVQALSYYCELETDRQRTGPGSEPLTDASENAVIGLPRLTEFVSSQLSCFYFHYSVVFDMKAVTMLLWLQN